MGTRSTTRIYEGDELLVVLYCQFDGFFENVGTQLASFITSRPLVNGIGGNDKVFNGMGCFAAQLIAHLKTEAGLWYICPASAVDDREEFNYTIRGNYEDPLQFEAEGYGESYLGTPLGFLDWVKNREESDDD